MDLNEVWNLLKPIEQIKPESPGPNGSGKRKRAPVVNLMPLPDYAWILVLGGFVGWLTSLWIKGSGRGMLGDISVGVIGAFLGGLLPRQMGFEIYGFWEEAGMSVMGSAFLLVAYRIFSPLHRAT